MRSHRKPPEPPPRRFDLAETDALIAEAEARLAAFEAAGGPPSDSSRVDDPVRCLGLWLAALRRHRVALLLPRGAGLH